MNNSDIDLIRKKYALLNLEKERIQKMKGRLLELESDPKVREYLSLQKSLSNVGEEEIQKEVLKYIDKIICFTKNSNKLLYDYDAILVEIYEPGSGYQKEFRHVCRDLETTEYYFKVLDSIEPMPLESSVGVNALDLDYYNLRNYFIEQIINRPQEEVIEELLQKNKRLVKGK